MTEAEINALMASLNAAQKLALAQRLLQALGNELQLTPDEAVKAAKTTKALSGADMKAMQASLAVQVQQSLSADPASTDWNALRKQMLGSNT